MPQILGEIPISVPIVEEGGAITLFFRQRWQELRDRFVLSPTVASVPQTAQTAAIATTSAVVASAGGLYRVSYYMRKTAPDGVSSSLTFTWGWTESGLPLTESAAALTLDATNAQQSGSKVLRSDANADLTFAIAYASSTPGQMAYRLDVVVEQLG
jgi:hypothetical protein